MEPINLSTEYQSEGISVIVYFAVPAGLEPELPQSKCGVLAITLWDNFLKIIK